MVFTQFDPLQVHKSKKQLGKYVLEPNGSPPCKIFKS